MFQPSSQDPVGANFSLENFLEARKTCIEVVDAVVPQIEPGMTQADCDALISQSFKARDIQKMWHPTKFRIGADTTKSFSEPSEKTQKIGDGEICFIDVGPIFAGHEADFGRSFVVGSGNSAYEKLAESSEEIFKKCVQFWDEEKSNGAELLAYAKDLAKSYGYTLNPGMSGHRVGDFPHKLYSSEKLFKIQHTPSKYLWILEIHLIEENLKRGAFFEDIMM